MARENTYFISDLHLGAKYMHDQLERERRVCRFLDSIRDDAAELFLLGDILDYWYEYKYVVPRGYIRFLGKLAELADNGVKLTWVTGNHDVWLFDYLRDQLGMTVLNGHTVVETQGKRILIAHGDDVGVQPAMYRFTRWCFYNKVCQWLYAAIHPRWTYPIATGWSNENRTRRDPVEQQAISERAASHLMDFSRDYHRQHPDVEAFVYGHIHIARYNEAHDGMPPVIFLGEWISLDSYLVLDGDGKFSLRYYGKND
jgi:UDP-2,3-diacylglucosamine hydrolase